MRRALVACLGIMVLAGCEKKSDIAEAAFIAKGEAALTKKLNHQVVFKSPKSSTNAAGTNHRICGQYEDGGNSFDWTYEEDGLSHITIVATSADGLEGLQYTLLCNQPIQ
jgi:hypothetical protein